MAVRKNLLTRHIISCARKSKLASIMKGWRSNLVIFFVILFLATILGRLIYIQILNHNYWKALAQGQQNIFEKFLGERGEIFLDGSSFPLATNRDATFVYLSPLEIKEDEKTAKTLSQALGLKEDLILEKINLKDNLFVLLKDRLTDLEIETLKNQNLTGIYLGKERERFYTHGSLASHILGFVGADGEGQYGVEGYYDDILKGKEEIRQGEKGPKGYLFFSNRTEKSSGLDITLTIDYNVQFMAEKLLESAKEDLEIEGGQVIVIDPNSGKIIALADFPNFDPNFYSEYAKKGDLEIFQNSVTQKIFEPGSSFKPITMAAALEEGKITPQTTYIDEGQVKIGGYTIYNYDGRKWGERSMTEVLEKSINTGAVFVERLLPHDVFLSYIKQFGFFEKSGVDLPEVFSENKEFKKGYEINFATCSFGQGIEITPIQLARAFCAIANGGKSVKPHLIDKKLEDGKLIETQQEVPAQIISQKTASQLTAMLVSVVENGFGKAAKIPGYYIAGKTGTAQVSFSALGIDKPGYSEKTVQTFLGFAPAFDPEFLILVKLDNPKTKTAEYSAVPIFRDLAKYIINLWQIPPDYEPR